MSRVDYRERLSTKNHPHCCFSALREERMLLFFRICFKAGRLLPMWMVMPTILEN